MRGFQLWVNLPAAEKMEPASYADIPDEQIPVYELDGVIVKALAGDLEVEGRTLTGACTGLSTEAAYLDVQFAARKHVTIAVPDGHTALVYVYEGRAMIGNSNYELKPGSLARLSKTGDLRVEAYAHTRMLVLSGKPIGEPIVQHGPFVMNSVDEIEQAIRDFSEGRLALDAATNSR